MKLLLDTHILLWAAASGYGQDDRLPSGAATMIDDASNTLVFSAASLWEITIKHGLKRPDFQADPHLLRRGLKDNGYVELPITSEHAVAVAGLPSLHRDPFDRLMVAQASVEGLTLLTSDPLVAAYPGPIRKV